MGHLLIIYTYSLYRIHPCTPGCIQADSLQTLCYIIRLIILWIITRIKTGQFNLMVGRMSSDQIRYSEKRPDRPGSSKTYKRHLYPLVHYIGLLQFMVVNWENVSCLSAGQNGNGNMKLKMWKR